MGTCRQCGQCGKPLSRYTSGDVCNACVVAARSQPEDSRRVAVPLEFWFQPEIRAALERWRWDVVLVAIYTETGAPQTQLAHTAGVSQAQISRLMHGKTKSPTIQTVLGVVDGFGIPRLLVGLAPKGLVDLVSPAATVDPGAGQAGGQVRRREFGKTILVSLLPGVGGAAEREPVDATKLEPTDLITDLHALDDRYGGGTVADLAERRLHSVTQQLRDVSLPARAEARVHRVVGTLSICAGWLAHDAGRYDRAGQLYKEGLYYADVANDRGIRLHALANMSMLANETGHSGDAVRLAQAAFNGARRADMRLQALLTMRVARAASEHGDAQLVRDSHRKAWRLLEGAATLAAKSSWFRFFDAMELAGLEGICAARMGRDAEAAQSFRRVIDHSGTYARNRAMYAARLAEALAKARQVDEAVGVIHTELPLFMQVTSAGVLDRLAAADRALKPYMGASGVNDCREILAGLLGH